MPIDMNKARERMKQLQKERRDYSKISYGLKEGANTLRFVTPPGEDWPFIYGSQYRNMKMKRQYFISPSMYDERDPILQQLQKLKKMGSAEDAEFARKLFPTNRVFALAIVRGQEEKGIVWVDFPQKVQKQLVQYILNQEYGDITDIHKGTDFTITKTKGNPFPEYSITPKRTTSPLLPNKQDIENVIKEIPDFKQAFKHFTEAQMEEIWNDFLTGSDDSGVADSKDDVIPDEEETVDVSAALLKYKNKKAQLEQ